MKKAFFIAFVLCNFMMSASAQIWNTKDGIYLYKTGSPDAKNYFEGYAKTQKNDPIGYYYLGLIYKNENNFDKSNYNFKKAYELKNFIVQVDIAPAVSDLPVGDYLDIAKMYFENENPDKGLTYLNLVEKIDPDNSEASYLKSEIYLKQEKKDLAKKYFLKALETNNTLINSKLAETFEIKVIPEFNGDFYHVKGLQHFYSGDISGAIKNFKKAIAKDRFNSQAQNDIGVAYFISNDLKNAKKHFKKAVMYDWDNFEAYYNLSRVEAFEKNRKSELFYLKQGVKINPNDKYTYFALGNFYLNESKFEDAKESFKKAILLDNNYLEAYLALADCCLKENNEQEAIVTMRKALAVDPENPDVQYYLAQICIKNSNFEEAKEYSQNALSKAENPFYYRQLGNIYFAQNDKETAGENYQKAIEMFQNLNDIYNAEKTQNELKNVFKN